MRIPGLTTVLAAAAVLALALPAAAQKTSLLVYTALETDQLKAYQEGFNKVHPDIEIKWVRDSTGVTPPRPAASVPRIVHGGMGSCQR